MNRIKIEICIQSAVINRAGIVEQKTRCQGNAMVCSCNGNSNYSSIKDSIIRSGNRKQNEISEPFKILFSSTNNTFSITLHIIIVPFPIQFEFQSISNSRYFRLSCSRRGVEYITALHDGHGQTSYGSFSALNAITITIPSNTIHIPFKEPPEQMMNSLRLVFIFVVSLN